MGLYTSDDNEHKSRWETYFSSNTVDCHRKLGGTFEKDISIDFAKQ